MRRLASALIATALSAQTVWASCAADAMLVFDGSNSMGGIGFAVAGAPRIDEARAALALALPRVDHIRRIGLITYGPGRETFCDGVDLRFPPIAAAAGPILTDLAELTPNGLTPLSLSVEMAAEALDFRQRPAMIVVVTDGNDTCGGQPCALADRLMAEGANLTVHVLGFKVVGDVTNGGSAATRPLPRGEIIARCLAERSGGHYILADTVEELVVALTRTLGCRPLSSAHIPVTRL